MAKASDNTFPKVIVSEGSTPSSPSAGSQTLYIDSSDHKLKRVNSSGTVSTIDSTGRGLVSKSIQRYTGGSITLNSATWASVSGPSDLTIAASSGDLLEVGVSGLWGNETLEAYLDFASIVSASPVNYVSGGTGGASNRGVVGWQAFMGPSSGSMNCTAQGVILYTVQSGDLSGGNIALRLRYRTSSASNKTLFATADIPLHLFVANLGQ